MPFKHDASSCVAAHTGLEKPQMADELLHSTLVTKSMHAIS